MDEVLYKELLQAADDVLQVARRFSFTGEEFRAIPFKWFEHLAKAVNAIKLNEKTR